MDDYQVGKTYEIDGVLMRYEGNYLFVRIADEAQDLAKRFESGGPLSGQDVTDAP